MTSKKELVARWKSEPGRAILERVHAFFRETQSSGHGRSSRELFALLEGLPFRDEVSGGRDLRAASLGGGTRELDLQGCDFTYARLTFNLAQCDLGGARFDQVAAGNGVITDRLDGASFVGAKLRGTFFQGARAHNCRFDDAVLNGASFEHADLEGSSFRNADCRRAKFTAANLAGCDFRGARLDEAVLQEARVDEDTDLRGASLVNVFDRDLRDRAGNIVARGTDWRRARIDGTTVRGTDALAASRELIDAVLQLAEASQRPWAPTVVDLLRRARANPGAENVWYDELLAVVEPEARGEVERLVAEAMRSLL
jgi:uncharacterized protein YjbI with pentapeptide repeats